MVTLEILLNLYINGQHSEVDRLARASGYNLTELFCYYIDEHRPSTEDLKLFVIRMFG